MNVRLTLKDAPQRTDLYGGIKAVTCDGDGLYLHKHSVHCLPDVIVPLKKVANIALDDEPGDWW